MKNSKNKIIAVVLARGGSKSIPRKNLKELRGTPLVSWVLRAFLNAPSVDCVLLSSDDSDILEIGSSEGAENHIRLASDSEDSTSSEQSLLAALEDFDPEWNFDTVILVQPTSPFTRSSHVQEAIAKFLDGDFDSIVTCTQGHVNSWEASQKEIATPNYDPEKRSRRQDLGNTFIENGAFYIVRRRILEKNFCRLGGRIGIYEMPYHLGWEIDEPLDWFILESIADNLEIFPETSQ